MNNEGLNILLVAPKFVEKWNKLDLHCKENLSIACLSAFLKEKGFNVTAVNAQIVALDNEQILDKYKDIQFDLIGVSCSAQKLYLPSKDFILKARKLYPNAYIVMGGIFPSLSYENILSDIKEIDAVSLGEGEISLLEICHELKKKKRDFSRVKGIAYREGDDVVVNFPERVMELDELPFPERSDEGFGRINGVTAYVMAGKGCYGNCSYCSIQSCFNFHRRICRSAKNVVDEIEILLEKYGVTHIQFNDDIFYNYSTNSQKWLDEFIKEVERRQLSFTFRIYLRPNDVKAEEIIKLKRIGLKTVFIGAESGVQRILDEMNKNITPKQIIDSINTLKACGVEIDLGFITLVPTMTFDELLKNYEFLYALGADVCTDANLHNRLNIYNGCEYERILEEYNLLEPKENFWDIHSYRFKDERVQKYHDTLQIIKKYAKNTKILENQIISLYDLQNNSTEIPRIKQFGVCKWMQITQLLLDKVKNNDTRLDDILLLIDEFENHHKELVVKLSELS